MEKDNRIIKEHIIENESSQQAINSAVSSNLGNHTDNQTICKQKKQKNVKVEYLINWLDEMDEGDFDIQVERIGVIDKLCHYIDDRDVLFRIVLDLILYGPTFGTYYDLIIPYFRSDTVLDTFIDYCEKYYWDNWRRDVNRLLEAIDCENEDGLYIVNGVLKAVYKESDILVIPETVHTLGKHAIGNYELSIIKKVVLPNTIRRIEDAFCLHYDDFEIVYQGSVEEWGKIEIGKNQSGTEWFSRLNVIYTND